jgi:hypothetical protein
MATTVFPRIITVQGIAATTEQGRLARPQVKVNGTKASVGWYPI